MTGSVAQLISLISFGNEFLLTGNLQDGFYPNNTTFQFCNVVTFVELKKKFIGNKYDEKVLANNPVLWFKSLKEKGCNRLRLAFQNSDQLKAKDYQLAGLVGGGGTWFIEAIHDDHSNFWVGDWQVTDRNAKKIWSIKYVETYKDYTTQNIDYDLSAIRDELSETLKKITDFAFENNFPFWGEKFEKAERNLNNTSPYKEVYHQDLIINENYPLFSQQILFSAAMAWVFGAMGSWNDMWFENAEVTKKYDELTSRLYNVVITAIIAAVNSQPIEIAK